MKAKLKTKYLLIPIVAFMLGILTSNIIPSSTPAVSEGILYHGVVCVQTSTGFKECNHNIIVNNGKEYIEKLLVGQATAGAKQIALGNSSSTLQPTDTALPNEFANGCSLTNATGAYVDAGTGQWNITYQWTSGCDSVLLNSTALYNATAGSNPVLFAEATFTGTTLSNNDKINVTWGIYVS